MSVELLIKGNKLDERTMFHDVLHSRVTLVIEKSSTHVEKQISCAATSNKQFT